MNDLERMNHAGKMFTQSFNRVPNLDELLIFYVELNLNTGSERQNRVSRAQNTIYWLTKNFRPKKNSTPVNPLRYLEWVKANVNPSDITDARYCRNLPFEDIALFIHIVTPNAQVGKPCSIEYIRNGFRNLKREGKQLRTCDTKKKAALVRLCISMGIFVQGSHYKRHVKRRDVPDWSESS